MTTLSPASRFGPYEIRRPLGTGGMGTVYEAFDAVLDFGIARRLAGPHETTYTATPEDFGAAGTLPYMAPEVLRGTAATTRSDVWSLGVLLYEMVTGRLPFYGATGAATAAAILHDPLPPLPSSTSPTIGHVITGCLDKDPSRRPVSATEIVRTLEVTEPVPPRLSSFSHRRATEFAIAVLLGIVTAAAGIAGRLRTSPGLNRPANAIAVLPFDNLSGDAEQEFFSDGMTEQVITDLGRLKALRVIARGSVMHYKTHPKPPAAAAKELGVDALVDGAVLRVGDRVRVTAQLIAPDDGRVLWSDSFDRDARDILAMQAEIATAIARQVRATIAPDEARSLAATYSPNPKAHELYLLGRYHTYRKTPQSAKMSVDYLVEATRLDPGFALAYASLAEAHRLREIWGGVPVGSFAEESRQAASRALELDPNLPEAHMAMAIYYSQREWNWSAADAEFARAIAGRPSLSDAHAEFSFHLQGLGRYEEGVAAAQRAVLLDPLSPDHLSQEGRALFRARRYSEASESFKKALELDSDFGSALSRLIDVYLVTGQYSAAEALLQKRREALGEATVQTAQLYAKTGRLAEARALMVLSPTAAGGGIGVGPALVAVALGQHDAALDSIERAVRARRLTAFSLRDPRFDPIVSSPRFRQVLRDMNLPE